MKCEHAGEEKRGATVCKIGNYGGRPSLGTCGVCPSNTARGEWPTINGGVIPSILLSEAWKTRGPKMWEEFHAYLAAWNNDAGSLAYWLAGFVGRLGCGHCQKHFMGLITNNPPDTYNVVTLIKWGIDRHNDVNTQLGKPQFKAPTYLAHK